MLRLLKISWLNVKNAAYSKEFLAGIIAAFSYSMMWALIIRLPKYNLDGCNFEFMRFLYVIILYAAVSTLRNDIKFNTTKAIFTGVFSRTEIMISKIMGLLIWGIVFFTIAEANNVLVSCILYKEIGLTGFLEFNHIQLFIIYMVVTFTMGSFMLMVVSIKFNDKKSILFFILIFSMINFYTAGVSMMVIRHPELAYKLSAYMKTPFYNVEFLNHVFNIQSVIISLAWAIVFIITSILIMNKREIK